MTDENTAENESAAEALVAIPDDFAMAAFGHSLGAEQLSEIPAKVVASLIEAGFSYAMRQGGVVSKKNKEGKSESEVDALVKAGRDARFAAICDGTYGTRKGGAGRGKSALERTMGAIATERLKARASAMGVPMPKGDVRKAAIVKIIEIQAADIEAEANARMSAAAAAAKALEGVIGA